MRILPLQLGGAAGTSPALRREKGKDKVLSWIAAGAYLLVALLGLVAGYTVRRTAKGRSAAWLWRGIALLFLLLAINRAFAIEDQIRGLMRLWLDAEGEYQARRSIQGPIAAVLLGVGGIAGIGLLLGFRQPARGRAARALAWAARAAAVMIGLVALRLVSLHATDALLYAPLRLNWIIDIGCTLMVAACAVTFIRALRSPR